MRRFALTVLTAAAAACNPDDSLPIDPAFSTPERIATDVNDSWDPRLAVSANGQANVLWLALDTDNEWAVWSNRFVPENGWGLPSAIEQVAGSAQWPALVADDGGNAIAAWTSSIGAVSTMQTNRLLVGSGWGTASPFGDAPGRPRLAMNRTGFAMMVWTTPPPSSRLYAARFDPAVGWSAPEPIDLPDMSPSWSPLVAMDDAGNAIAVWADSGFTQGTQNSIWANRFGVASGWGTPIMLASNEEDADVTSLAMNRAGDAVVMTYEFTNGPGDGVFATYFDRAEGWQVHTLVERASHPDVATAAIDEDGNVIAAWGTMSGLPNDVYAAVRPRGGGWGAPERIGLAQDRHGLDEDPRVSLVVDPTGRALAVWWQVNGAWLNRYTPGVGWDAATLLRGGDVSLPQLGVDDAGRTMAVWIEDGDVFAASASGERRR